MSDSQQTTQSIAGRGISGGMVLLFAVATGQAVACNYLAQPLLETLRNLFGVSEATAGLIVTAAQIGYAAGLILLLPLGDLFERRRLIITLAAVTVAGLAVAAAAPSIGLFIVATAVIGMTSVMAQLLVPFAATLAPEAERGRVVGNVMSGLILGILLARTFSGLIAQAAGWRAVYVIAAVLMLAQARVAVRQAADASASRPGCRIRSCWRLCWRSRAASRCCAAARCTACSPSPRSASCGPPSPSCSRPRPSTTATASSASSGWSAPRAPWPRPIVGHYTDRGWVYWLTGGGCLLTLLAFIGMWFGRASLPFLIAGILILDVGSQGIHISNQSEIYRLRPEARNRINAFYMTSCFIGAAVGSASAAFAYDRWGWAGTCVLGVLLGVACVVRWATDRQRPLAERELYPEADPPV